MLRIVMAIVVLSMVGAGCAEVDKLDRETEPSPSGKDDTGSDTASDTESGTPNSTESGTPEDTGTTPGTVSETTPETQTDSESQADSESHADSETPEDTGSDTASSTGSDSEVGSDSEAGSDSGVASDTDSETSSDTGEEVAECPWNEGYPCPCNQATCDDGTGCATYGGSLYGMCSKPCTGATDLSSCDNADFGLVDQGGGRCLMQEDTDSDPELCAIVCEQGEDTGVCPESLQCEEMGGGTSVCVPQPLGDDEAGDGTCAVNSRYPCPCNQATCDDGSTCVNLDEGTDNYCARPCNGFTDYTSCDGIKGYGLQGICNITDGNPDVAVFCSVLCAYDGTVGDGCPATLECSAINAAVSLCM